MDRLTALDNLFGPDPGVVLNIIFQFTSGGWGRERFKALFPTPPHGKPWLLMWTPYWSGFVFFVVFFCLFSAGQEQQRFIVKLLIFSRSLKSITSILPSSNRQHLQPFFWDSSTNQFPLCWRCCDETRKPVPQAALRLAQKKTKKQHGPNCKLSCC